MTINNLLTRTFASPPPSAVASSAAPVRQSSSGGCDCGQSDCPNCGGGATKQVTDTVELSPAALAFDQPKLEPVEQTENESPDGLTKEEQQQVQELKARDTEVRQHEQAHLAAAGPYAIGGPTYEYQQGPDGNRYAIGGEVQIDTAPIDGDPAATIQKMQTVRAAALAPAEPSGQDRKVAAQAASEIQRAQAELAQQRLEESSGEEEDDAASSSNPYAEAKDEVGERVDIAA